MIAWELKGIRILTLTTLWVQIEAADKQLKSTRQFLEEQAIEREQERDEFSREIERLKGDLKDKDKGKSSHELLKKEVNMTLPLTWN